MKTLEWRAGHTPFGAQAETLNERTVRSYDVRYAASDIVAVDSSFVIY